MAGKGKQTSSGVMSVQPGLFIVFTFVLEGKLERKFCHCAGQTGKFCKTKIRRRICILIPFSPSSLTFKPTEKLGNNTGLCISDT